MNALGVADFAHVMTSLVLFGLAAFPFYAGDAGATTRARWMTACAWGAMISGAAAMALHAETMGVDLLALAQAGIGRVWVVQIVLALVLALGSRAPAWLVALLAGLNAALFALIGHANAIAGWVGASAQAVHLITAGGWAGGIIALTFALRENPSAELVQRFSRVGLISVVLLALSGVLVLNLNTGAPLPMTYARYGQLALLKIALFAAALALAALNRFYSTPRGAWALLRRVIVGEFALVATIVAVAIALAGTEPYG
jgi:putative copper resistance protein D